MNQSQGMVPTVQADLDAVNAVMRELHPLLSPGLFPAAEALLIQAFARHRLGAEARTRAAEDRVILLEAQNAKLGRQLVDQQLTELSRQREIQAMIRRTARSWRP